MADSESSMNVILVSQLSNTFVRVVSNIVDEEKRE